MTGSCEREGEGGLRGGEKIKIKVAFASPRDDPLPVHSRLPCAAAMPWCPLRRS